MGWINTLSSRVTKLKSITPNHLGEDGAMTTTVLEGYEYPEESSNPDTKKKVEDLRVASLESITNEKDLPPGYKHHVFEDPEVARYYADMYKESQYEGRDHFDPSFTWTTQEEKKVVWKTEWRVTLWAFIMFFALDIDRFNLQNAIAGSLFEDIGITQNEYNTGSTINYVCFLLAEVPSQLISKKLGPDVWIPMQMVGWSLVAIFQCFMKNKAGFYATRGLIGAIEGGFIPDVTLWISYFYTNRELAVRMGYFYIANAFTSAISGLLAYGIQHLDGRGGWAGWQYIFMIEGLMTLLIGVGAFFMMPPSVVQTKARWRPKGWYTDREEKIMVNRILRDDPSKGDMHNREGITPGSLWKSCTDWHMWPIYWCRLFQNISSFALSRYMAIILKSMGFSTLNVDLLLIPSNIGTIITTLASVYLTQYTGIHSLPLTIGSVWLSVCYAAMRWWPGFIKHKWASYALLVVTVSFPPPEAITSSWVSINVNSVRTRTVAAALLNVHCQAGAIVAANLLRSDDAPYYHRATTQLFAVSITGLVTILGTGAFYWYINKKRNAEWKALSHDQQMEYLKEHKDEGNKRLDFRFSR